MRDSASYCRIRAEKDDAVRRFAKWNRLRRPGPVELVTIDDPDELANDMSRGWREVVFVSEVGGWTLFNDLTGAFTLRETARWIEFAGPDEFVFAAYNAGLGYAEVLAVSGGAVVREFRDSADAPEQNADEGRLDSPHEPFRGWEEVAEFVAGDPLGFSNTGWVWLYDLK